MSLMKSWLEDHCAHCESPLTDQEIAEIEEKRGEGFPYLCSDECAESYGDVNFFMADDEEADGEAASGFALGDEESAVNSSANCGAS